MTRIRIKRVYEPAAPDDGCRVLVDKLWPRGVRKDALHYDVWAKEITPSPELRTWYHADPQTRWPEFRRRYLEELRGLGRPCGILSAASPEMRPLRCCTHRKMRPRIMRSSCRNFSNTP